MGQPGFFDLNERYQRLSENGDPLVKLAALIDFEAFRPKLAAALKRSDGSKGGRPPDDPVLMFKILILQTLYTLSDDATEFQIRDRLSFMRFLGLGFEGKRCEGPTFSSCLDTHEVGRAYGGGGWGMAKATLDARPKGRNEANDYRRIELITGLRRRREWPDDEKARIIAESAEPGANISAVARRHDLSRGLLTVWRRAAGVGGSNDGRGDAVPETAVFVPVEIGCDDGVVGGGRRAGTAKIEVKLAGWPAEGDTAYRSKTNEAYLAKHGLRSRIHFRRRPGCDLTPSERKANRARSTVRLAVETVFAGQKHRFGLVVRTIGLARARTKIGLANLAYDLKRVLWIETRLVAA